MLGNMNSRKLIGPSERRRADTKFESRTKAR